MNNRLVKNLALIACFLTLIVVVLGGYTRLTDAGLGCPDWPGCYGQILVNNTQTTKAWTEMIHRYVAGTLGLLIFTLFVLGIRSRKKVPEISIKLLSVVALLVVFQAMLGMWTVTLKLWPIVVMSHLLGGLTIGALLVWFRWSLNPVSAHISERKFSGWVFLGIVLLFLQIALGGWVSSNYSALACVGFPACNGKLIPALNFSDAFSIYSAADINYEGGILGRTARETIHFSHRLGAFIVFIFWTVLSTVIWLKAYSKRLRELAKMCFGLLLLQCILGVINVTKLLPLWVAVAHNAVAALLLATVISLYYHVHYRNSIRSIAV